MNQDVIYDFMANLAGIGDRSVSEICKTWSIECYIDTDIEMLAPASVNAC